ncbi:hypothetical protein F0L68_11535 [Solihabitans fulvus]|uniref:Uncharacterized protein n=1 Tax=Solihabitans fulvus TaxID=1892852 RepID=A0A5B2XJB9_9PSEU|nr:hypothetical protein [Solihabitans fulvus]KAA2262852.1 hypothetical protein F0L68_11535 [Solihabitans fulvus]
MSLFPTVVQPLEVAASCAKALASLVAAVPPGAGRGSKSRDRRSHAYLEFQRAAFDLAGYVSHLRLLAGSRKLTPRRYLRTALSLADAPPFDSTGLRGLGQMARAIASVAKMTVAADLVGDALLHHAVYPVLAETRDAVSKLGAAAAELRLVGGTGPQEQAEAIIALLVELFDRVSAPDAEFEDCQATLGSKHRDFTVALRTDVARRWWHVKPRPRTHRWQWWRSPQASMLGGWVAPDPKKLIADAVNGRDRI